MSKEAKKEVERVNLLMDPNLRSAIKVWRHQQMIDTEGEAVRQLLRDALVSKGVQVAA